MMIPPPSSKTCGTCARWRGFTEPETEDELIVSDTGVPLCEAFPDGDGVPFEIYSGKRLHDAPVEGDHGLQRVAVEAKEVETEGEGGIL